MKKYIYLTAVVYGLCIVSVLMHDAASAALLAGRERGILDYWEYSFMLGKTVLAAMGILLALEDRRIFKISNFLFLNTVITGLFVIHAIMMKLLLPQLFRWATYFPTGKSIPYEPLSQFFIINLLYLTAVLVYKQYRNTKETAEELDALVIKLLAIACILAVIYAPIVDFAWEWSGSPGTAWGIVLIILPMLKLVISVIIWAIFCISAYISNGRKLQLLRANAFALAISTIHVFSSTVSVVTQGARMTLPMFASSMLHQWLAVILIGNVAYAAIRMRDGRNKMETPDLQKIGIDN